VEFNVRGRDMMSVVEEVQRRLNAKVKLPTGYRIELGGQFEHYQEAKSRLTVVVPLALSLIGFLLWLAFRSIRDALLIFLNVPFAIIGGVVALWARNLPFSISAGVGFIALSAWRFSTASSWCPSRAIWRSAELTTWRRFARPPNSDSAPSS